MAISCRNHRLRISSFMRIVCRFAVAGDMSPTYRGLPVDGIRPAESRAAFFETHNSLLYSIAQNRFKVYIFFNSKKIAEKEWKNAGLSVIINKSI